MTKNAWLNINQRGALTLSWEEGQKAPTLATAVNERKAIDCSKDFNVCTIQYIDNGLSFSRLSQLIFAVL